MLNELKHITKSQKMRVLLLLMVLAIVATLVVVAMDGMYEDPDYDGYTGNYYEYTMQPADYDYYVGYYHGYEAYEYQYAYNHEEYGYRYDYNPYYYNSGDEYYLGFSTFEEHSLYMYYMAGEAGDAPTMMFYD